MAPVEGALSQPFIGEIVDRLTALPHELCQNLRSSNLPPLVDMERRGMDPIQRNVKEVLDDLKINIQGLADFMDVGVAENRETKKYVKQLVDDVRYVSYQTSCHDSRIDDHDMDLKEMMGKTNHIQEYLQNLVQLN